MFPQNILPKKFLDLWASLQFIHTNYLFLFFSVLYLEINFKFIFKKNLRNHTKNILCSLLSHIHNHFCHLLHYLLCVGHVEKIHVYIFYWIIWKQLVYIMFFPSSYFSLHFWRIRIFSNITAVQFSTFIHLTLLHFSSTILHIHFSINCSNSVPYRICFPLVQNASIVFSCHITLVLFCLGTNSLVFLCHSWILTFSTIRVQYSFQK